MTVRTCYLFFCFSFSRKKNLFPGLSGHRLKLGQLYCELVAVVLNDAVFM